MSRTILDIQINIKPNEFFSSVIDTHILGDSF